jgi:hypothetical protein
VWRVAVAILIAQTVLYDERMKPGLLVVLLALLLAIAGGCNDATQLRLEAYTNVAQDGSVRLALYSGPRLDALSPDPAATPPVTWGPDGLVGSLVFVPPESNREALVAVRAVLAIGRDPATCSATNASGCIFADRELRYEKGRSLRVPVGLFRQCAGVVCATGQTCNYEARCVSARLEASQCATDTGCALPGDPPSPPGVFVPGPAVLDAGPAVAEPVAPLAPVLRMRDLDPRQGYIEGTLSVAAQTGSAPVSRIEVSEAVNGVPVGAPFSSTAGVPLPLSLQFHAGYRLSPGAEQVSAVAVFESADGRRATSPPTVITVDNYPRLRDISADQGADSIALPRILKDPLAPNRLLVFGIDPTGRPTLRVCEPDGSSCVGHVLGGAHYGLVTAHMFPVPGRGALVVATEEGILIECRSDGTDCATRSYGQLDFSGGASFLALVPDPDNPASFAVIQARDDGVLASYHCVGAVPCVATESILDAYPYPHPPAVGPAGVYFAAQDDDDAGIVVRCTALGAACVSLPLGPDWLYGAALAPTSTGATLLNVDPDVGLLRRYECGPSSCVPGALLNTPVGAVPQDTRPLFVFEQGHPLVFFRGVDEHLRAARCVGAQPCVVRDITAATGRKLLSEPLQIEVEGTGHYRVLSASVITGESVLFRCTPDLVTCTTSSSQAPQLKGYSVGDALDVHVDHASGRLMVVTENPSRGILPTLFSCALDATSCVSRDVSGTGTPQSGFQPTIVFDDAKRKLRFVADDRSNTDISGPGISLFTCDPDGTGCSSRALLGPDATPGPNRLMAHRTKSGRLRVFWHYDEYQDTNIDGMECDADGGNCLQGALPTPDGQLRSVHYDENTDRTFVVVGGSYSYFIGAYSCAFNAAASAPKDRFSCTELGLRALFPGNTTESLDVAAVTVEKGVPTLLLSYVNGLTDIPKFALARCAVPGSCVLEPLPINGDAGEFYGFQGAIQFDQGRDVRYLALSGADDRLALHRCDKKGCARLYTMPADPGVFRLLVDAKADRLYLIARNGDNNAQPAALVMDLF